MTQIVSMEIHGVKSTLEYLRRFEPEAYKRVQSEIRGIAKPVRDATAAAFPSDTGLRRSSGVRQWAVYGHDPKRKKSTSRGDSGYTFPRYDITAVRRGVKVQVGGRKNRATNTYPIMRVKQTDGAGQIYDLAAVGHSGAGQSFVKNLTGTASRVMWKVVPRMLPPIQRQIAKTLRQYEKDFNTQIATDMEMRRKLSASSSRQVRNALGQFGRMLG